MKKFMMSLETLKLLTLQLLKKAPNCATYTFSILVDDDFFIYIYKNKCKFLFMSYIFILQINDTVIFCKGTCSHINTCIVFTGGPFTICYKMS